MGYLIRNQYGVVTVNDEASIHEPKKIRFITPDYKEFSLFSELLPDSICFDSVNDMIDEYFSHHIEENKIKSITQELKTLLNKKLAKHKKA